MKLALKLTILAAALASLVAVPAPANAGPPSNDDFGHPKVISSFPATSTASTLKASRATDDPECGGDASVWFSWTPKNSRTILARTYDSDGFAVSVSAYVGKRGSLTQLACSTEEFQDAGIQIEVTAGTRYYFMIAGAFDGERGTARFSIEKQPALSLTMSRQGTVDQEGLVTLHGSFSCDQAGVAFFNVEGFQGPAQQTFGENFLDCPASSNPYEVQLLSQTDTPFGPGRIRIEFNARFVGDAGGTVTVVGTRTVCLRRI